MRDEDGGEMRWRDEDWSSTSRATAKVQTSKEQQQQQQQEMENILFWDRV